MPELIDDLVPELDSVADLLIAERTTRAGRSTTREWPAVVTRADKPLSLV